MSTQPEFAETQPGQDTERVPDREAPRGECYCGNTGY